MRRIRVVAVLICAMGILPATALGADWSIQRTPSPTGSTLSSLAAVSCPSAKTCVAVGSYGSPEAPLAEIWNGAHWSIQPTANPSGSTNSSLLAVLCTSATACTAVGQYTNSTGKQLTLAERWNAASWAIQATPNPTGALFDGSLAGVSCASTTVCTAVGSRGNSTGKEAT
jgi:hypothetical protein